MMIVEVLGFNIIGKCRWRGRQ